VSLPPNRLERWLHRCPGMFARGYALWQRRAYRLAKRLHADVGFDVAHQVSFCGYRQPGHTWKLDVPFVLGPVGGTQNFPWRFLGEADLLGGVREITRSAINRWQLRRSRHVRRACRRAALVMAATTTAQRDLEQSLQVPIVRQLETGVDPCPERPLRRRAAGEPLRILWTGGLRTWKALPLLLKALAQLPTECRYELRVLGRGNCRQRWERLSQRLGIDPSVHWLGWGPYSELVPHYQWADVFAFTSLRDTSGAGLLEALAAGVPIVGLNHQGAADIMTEDCAVPIPVTRPADTIAAFRDAIQSLANDDERLRRLRAGARERAAEFYWDRQGEWMNRVYRQIVAGKTLTPNGLPQTGSREMANGDETLLPEVAPRHHAPVESVGLKV
jgi:glycosyltransferase involved in cell wall biosynthesis